MSLFEPNNWLTTKIVAFIAKATPPCHDITRLLSQGMDRRLPLRKRLAIRFHFLVCDWCIRYARQLDFIRKASSTMPEHAEGILPDKLSNSAKDRMKHALETQQR